MEEKREEQKEMERETFQSRLGFLLLSAGCAIGIGNVWKFPYMVGNNGGGIFVLFYLLFLAIMGVPILSRNGEAELLQAQLCCNDEDC